MTENIIRQDVLGSEEKMQQLHEAIKKALCFLDDSEAIDAWNQYCSVNHCDSATIYRVDDLLDYGFEDMEPRRIVLSTAHDRFRATDEYCVYNEVYDWYISFDYADDNESPIFWDELADFVLDYADTRDCDLHMEDLLGDDYTKFFVDPYADEESEEDA